jgi:hypothetical protein
MDFWPNDSWPQARKDAYAIFKREYAIYKLMSIRNLSYNDAAAYIDKEHSHCLTGRDCPWMPPGCL